MTARLLFFQSFLCVYPSIIKVVKCINWRWPNRTWLFAGFSIFLFIVQHNNNKSISGLDLQIIFSTWSTHPHINRIPPRKSDQPKHNCNNNICASRNDTPSWYHSSLTNNSGNKLDSRKIVLKKHIILIDTKQCLDVIFRFSMSGNVISASAAACKCTSPLLVWRTTATKKDSLEKI